MSWLTRMLGVDAAIEEKVEHVYKGEAMGRTIWDDITASRQRSGINPDDVLNDRGRGLALFDRLARDPKVRGLERIHSDIVFSWDWDITGPEAEWHKQQLEQQGPVTFGDALRALLKARRYGFKLSEVIWGEREGKWVPTQIKSKRGHNIGFKTDVYDNLEYFFVGQDKDGFKFYPDDEPGRFLIHVFPSLEDGNWYGTSDYSTIYESIRSKVILSKHRNLYMQSCGFPERETWVDVALPAAKRDEAYASLDKRQENFELRVPAFRDRAGKLHPYIETKINEGRGAGDQAFERALDQLDRWISTGLSFPDDLGFGAKAGGSFAKSAEERDLLDCEAQHDREKICDTMNLQLMQPWYKFNFGEPKNGEYPKLVFRPKPAGYSLERGQAIKTIIDAGVIKKESLWAKGWAGIPEDEEPGETKPIPPAFGGPAVDKDGEPIEDPKKTAPAETQKDKQAEKEPGKTEKKSEHRAKIGPDYRSRVEHQLIRADFDRTEAESAKAFTNVISDIAGEIVTVLSTQKALTGKNTEILSKPIYDPKYRRALKKFAQQLAARSYYQGRASAARELPEEAEHGIGADYGWPEVDVSDFLDYDWLKKWVREMGLTLGPVDKAAIQKFADYGLFVSGEIDRGILSKVKNVLYGQGGKVTEQAMGKMIRDTVKDYGFAHINTIVRTNTSREYNAGRQAEFEVNSSIIEGYQYDAIIDEATTEFCARHDQQMIGVDNANYGSIIPPNHYNCRSLLAPVFVGEEFVDNWNVGIPAQYQTPEKGFGGW